MGDRSRDAIAITLALLAGLLAQAGVRDLELVGWDSYPVIAASRAGSPAEAIGGTFEPWMDDRYPRGRFHRPLAELSVALDHAVWGLAPRGYQLSNLMVFLFAIFGVYALARRWLGDAWGAGIAALLFALHPAHSEIVPVTARRGEMLAIAFTALALSLHPRPRGGGALASALLGLCAVASKETGAVVLPAAFAAEALLGDHGTGNQGTARARWRHALRACAPMGAALLGLLVWRVVALGALGGHPQSSFVGGALTGLARAPAQLRSVLFPQPWFAQPAADAAAALLCAGALAAALVWMLRAAPERGRPIGVLAVWTAVLLALVGVSGDLASWYVAPFVAPLALLLAALATWAWRSSRRGFALLLVLAPVFGVLARAPAWTAYPAWETVSRQQADFLARADAALRGARAGETVRVGGLPVGEGAPLERVGVRSALGLSDYGLAAWAELQHPERRVRVVLQRGDAATPPEPGVITLEAVPQSSPVLDLLLGPPR